MDFPTTYITIPCLTIHTDPDLHMCMTIATTYGYLPLRTLAFPTPCSIAVCNLAGQIIHTDAGLCM
jgi:hypothetical protein